MIDLIKQRIGFRELLPRLGIEVQKNGFIFSIYRQEKTASTKIDFKKNLYYDFSIGEGGDLLKFYKDYTNSDYKTVINQLASMAGIDNKQIEEFTRSIPDRKQIPEKGINIEELSKDESDIYYESLRKYNDVNKAIKDVQLVRLKSNKEIFMKFWSYCWDGGFNKYAMQYLMDNRKMQGKTLWNFKLFTVSDYYRVNGKLKAEFPIDRLKQCGLFNQNGNLIFAKHRLLIPYLWGNDIVYIRGRYFDENGNWDSGDGPKYIGLKNDSLNLNSPKRFFNGFQLKTMVKGERVFITEGEFDTMIIEQIGFNSVAIPGAGNIAGIEKLKDFRVVICMDNDLAGSIARDKLVNLMISNNIDYTIKDIEDKDVNDWYIRRVS